MGATWGMKALIAFLLGLGGGGFWCAMVSRPSRVSLMGSLIHSMGQFYFKWPSFLHAKHCPGAWITSMCYSIRIPFFCGMRIFGGGSLLMSCTKRRIEGGPRCFFSLSASVSSSSNIIPNEFPMEVDKGRASWRKELGIHACSNRQKYPRMLLEPTERSVIKMLSLDINDWKL